MTEAPEGLSVPPQHPEEWMKPQRTATATAAPTVLPIGFPWPAAASVQDGNSNRCRCVACGKWLLQGDGQDLEASIFLTWVDRIS